MDTNQRLISKILYSRNYEESAVRRLEQILILRKLNISIKDIQRIFSTSSSDIVLEVLEKKVQNIDDEVALLHELKDIVLDFIHEIERVDFADNSDIKRLYDKAKELETQLISVDMAVSIDEDDESIHKVEDKIFRWIESTNFEHDKSRDFMCNIPNWDEADIANKDIEKGLGYKHSKICSNQVKR